MNFDLNDKPTTIIVNGKTMSVKEFKAMQKAKKAAKKAKKQTKTFLATQGEYKDTDTLKSELNDLIKKVAPFKSLNTFYSHAQRSYGNVAEKIFKPISREYTAFRTAFRNVEECLDKIQDCKSGESEVYDLTTTLSWRVDDMKTALIALCNKAKEEKPITKRLYEGQAVWEGRYYYGNKTPRELGYKQQLFMAHPSVIDKTIKTLEEGISKMQKWANNGQDPLTYKI